MDDIHDLQQRVAYLEAIIANMYKSLDDAGFPKAYVLTKSVRDSWTEAGRLIAEAPPG